MINIGWWVQSSVRTKGVDDANNIERPHGAWSPSKKKDRESVAERAAGEKSKNEGDVTFFLILTLMSENSKELFGLGNLWLWVDVL